MISEQSVQSIINLVYTVQDNDKRQELTVQLIESFNQYLANSSAAASAATAPVPASTVPVVKVKPDLKLYKKKGMEKAAFCFSNHPDQAAAVSYAMKDYTKDDALISDFKSYLKEVSLQDFTNDWMLLAPRTDIAVYLFENSLSELDEFFARTMEAGDRFKPLVEIMNENTDLSAVKPKILRPECKAAYAVSSRLKMAVKTSGMNQDIWFEFDYEQHLVDKGIGSQAEVPFVSTPGQAGWLLDRIKTFY